VTPLQRAMASVSGPPLAPGLAVHPGEILREEIQARGLTQTALAEQLRRPVQLVNEVCTGKRSVTPATALGLERVLGVSADFWVRLQAAYDLDIARVRAAKAGGAM
jgi:addiction module HigA family antidote